MYLQLLSNETWLHFRIMLYYFISNEVKRIHKPQQPRCNHIGTFIHLGIRELAAIDPIIASGDLLIAASMEVGSLSKNDVPK